MAAGSGLQNHAIISLRVRAGMANNWQKLRRETTNLRTMDKTSYDVDLDLPHKHRCEKR